MAQIEVTLDQARGVVGQCPQLAVFMASSGYHNLAFTERSRANFLASIAGVTLEYLNENAVTVVEALMSAFFAGPELTRIALRVFNSLLFAIKPSNEKYLAYFVETAIGQKNTTTNQSWSQELSEWLDNLPAYMLPSEYAERNPKPSS